MVNQSTVLRRDTAGLRRYTDMLAPYAVTVLRILVGITFLLTGLPKAQNFAGFTGFVASLGFPVPVVFAAMHLSWGAGFLAGCVRFGVRPAAIRSALRPR